MNPHFPTYFASVRLCMNEIVLLLPLDYTHLTSEDDCSCLFDVRPKTECVGRKDFW